MLQNLPLLHRKNKHYFREEYEQLLQKEEKMLSQRIRQNPPSLQKKLEDVVPENLQGVLNKAFRFAFSFIFEKGTTIIEKSYNKDDLALQYKINEYTTELLENKKTVQAFSKQASAASQKNLWISSIEGIGLGALGIGIPDIPIFTALLFKSIYEIALHYGFSYDTEEEQCFILKLIAVGIEQGKDLPKDNAILNRWIERGEDFPENKEKLMTLSAQALSDELLYLKFLQGIPVVGIIGGLSDTVYLKKITDYAHLKYKRRFLKKKILENPKHA
jgi:hypothetical protein